MFTQLDMVAKALGLARHAAARQGLVATNIANADTPGYRAQDLPDFAETWRDAPAIGLRTTRPGHVTASTSSASAIAAATAPGTEAPNGNTVSLEGEMIRAAELRQNHELALGVYRAGLSILRTSLGRRG